MQGRIGGQALIGWLQEEYQRNGPRTAVDRFFGTHVFKDVRCYTIFWQVMAQQVVADRLDKSGGSWRNSHDLSIGEGGAFLPNLVITPAGVYAVSGIRGFGQPLRVSGRSLRLGKNPESSVLMEVEEHAELISASIKEVTGLDIRVQAVLCWLDVGEVEIPIAPVAVRLVHLDHLVQVISDISPVLGPSEIAVIGDAVDSPLFWTNIPISPINNSVVLDALTAILDEIEQRNRTRKRWKKGVRWMLLLGCSGAALAAYPVLVSLHVVVQ